MLRPLRLKHVLPLTALTLLGIFLSLNPPATEQKALVPQYSAETRTTSIESAQTPDQQEQPTLKGSHETGPLRQTALDPKDWSKAKIIAEKTDPTSSEEGTPLIRRRILRDDGFPFPVLVTDRLEYDESGNLRKTTNVSAYAANQILLNASDTISAGEVHAIATSLGWEVQEKDGSQYFSIIETDAFDFDTTANAIASIKLSGSSLAPERNHIFYTLATPNDPKFIDKSQWGLDQDTDFDIDASEGWDTRTSASNVIIAIVDAYSISYEASFDLNNWFSIKPNLQFTASIPN